MQTFSYGPQPEQALDICAPAPGQATLPAVLMIHGGGWQVGSRRGLGGRCAEFAKLGIVAIPVDYRLATGDPATRWPTQFNDVQLAMRWVRAHAGSYGIDPDHICAEGDSAGGQLALLLGVVPTIEAGDTQGLLGSISPRANCVVSISGPTDFISYSKPYRGVVNRLIGAQDTAHTLALETSASPLLRLRAGAPPTLLIHGMSDPAVAFSQAELMWQALLRSGTASWLVRYDGGHVLHGLAAADVRKTWRLIADFVESRRLSAPPGELTLDAALAGAD